MFYIQLIGLLAFCIVVLSFYKKTQAQILAYQVTSTFAYGVHYFLLGALSGAFISLIGVIRNLVFIKVKSHKNLISFLFLFVYLIITIIFFEKFYSIFPMCANMCYLIAMSRGGKKNLLIGAILCSLFWILYSVFVFSYVCIITETILIISNIIQLKRLK